MEQQHVHEDILIRPAVATDESALVELALVNEMFAEDELPELVAVFRDAVGGDLEDHRWWMSVGREDRVVAAAYAAPEPFADRLWNLYFIAVSPECHGAGVGTQLIEHVEGQLRAAGERTARVLVVETSSTERYSGARGFYVARGFVEEARIRQFYGPDDDKVVFWKSLTD